uniref:Uncharacterized protein n=1 Tax=Arundo donax TaxID=35708 RepID=A0A0A8ZW39_ARUDO
MGQLGRHGVVKP